ncbi:LysR substrate-binding domain-containing protein [uncultured Corynebacterium sp.]|uniref:LysR substrate-binding domain-containing protein n=1 Tax=uncultured Corynebacterium sp. TaxID=159447 RepID=UPI0025E24F66|nr:LysR substrate-binding domain-containing protein [uncultured Corynebacterium sp.]
MRNPSPPPAPSIARIFSTIRCTSSPPTTGPWSTLGIEDLDGVPFAIDPPHLAVGRFSQEQCRRHGFAPRVQFETPDPFLHVHLVRQGHAVSFISELFLPLADAVRVVPLPDSPARTLYTAVLPGREAHPAIRAFRAALHRAAVPTATPNAPRAGS